MTPLPAALDAAATLVAWRIDAQRYAESWDSGVGAEALGGRWNPKGVKAVYCSIDPSTCLVETAVHRGFAVLDTHPHILTSLEVPDTTGVRVVMPRRFRIRHGSTAESRAGISKVGEPLCSANTGWSCSRALSRRKAGIWCLTRVSFKDDIACDRRNDSPRRNRLCSRRTSKARRWLVAGRRRDRNHASGRHRELVAVGVWPSAAQGRKPARRC